MQRGSAQTAFSPDCATSEDPDQRDLCPLPSGYKALLALVQHAEHRQALFPDPMNAGHPTHNPTTPILVTSGIAPSCMHA
jgi:hypothetical protein